MTTKKDIISLLIFFLLVIAISPLEPIRYHFVLSATFIIGVFILFFGKGNLHVYGIFSALALISISLIFQNQSINTFNDIKDIFRWVPLLLLVRNFQIRIDIFELRFFWLILICTLFDFIVLLLGASEDIRQRWYEAATTTELNIYIGEYYRHIGILGNPNYSSLLYVIFILWLLTYYNQSSGKIWRLLTFTLILLNTALLISTMSRTGLLSLGVALLLS